LPRGIPVIAIVLASSASKSKREAHDDDFFKDLPLRRALTPLDTNKRYFDDVPAPAAAAKRHKTAVAAFASK